MRVRGRKRIIATAIAALIISVLQTATVAALKSDAEIIKDLNINSKAVFLHDIDRGKTILSQNADQKLPVASLTKIMTALVVLEKRQPNDVVTISRDMVSNLGDYVAIGLQVGQRVTVEELLYATMLPSAGDASQALAISTSGSIASFADAMNQKAEALGLKNTHFSNPVGMNGDNYSTAHDIAVILQAALQNEMFKTIFETYDYQLKSVNLTAKKTFTKRADILGGKTGYTQLAGRCFASSSTLNGVDYILVTLGANPDSSEHIKDAERIYAYVKETYIEQKILQSDSLIKTLAVTDSEQKTLELRAKQDVRIILRKDIEPEQLVYTYDGIAEITPEVPLGSKIGTYSIRNGEEVLYQTDLYLEDEIEFYNYPLIIATFVGAGVAVALVVAAVAAIILRIMKH